MPRAKAKDRFDSVPSITTKSRTDSTMSKANNRVKNRVGSVPRPRPWDSVHSVYVPRPRTDSTLSQA
jgi:hypothetical protein